MFYYTDVVPLEALFLEGGRIEPALFVSSWKSIPDANEATKQLPLGIASVEELQVTDNCKCWILFKSSTSPRRPSLCRLYAPEQLLAR